MNILPEFAIRYRTIVFTVVGLLVIWGIVSFQTMPRREDPEFTIMTCVVTTPWPGVSAEKVEELITDPLEEVLDGIEEVDVLRSTSINGLSTIFVDLYDNVSPAHVDQVWDQVRACVRNVEMPEENITPIVTDDFGDTSVILFAIYQKPLPGQTEIEPHRIYTDRDLDLYSERVRDALRLLDGVAKVQRFGVREEAIYIETDAGTWSQLQLTTGDLKDLISDRNIIEAGGLLDTGDGRFYVKPGGKLDVVNEINTLVADLSSSDKGSNQVYLNDLGLNVRRAYQDPPSLICRYSDPETSQSAVIVAVTMKSGSNIIDICNASKARLEEMQHQTYELPPDLGLVPISDQSESVNNRIHEVIINVIEAVIIVVVVVYLVVGFRTATVMAANIPFVTLIAVGVITLFGVQLEQMSLASMIISLGLLVDNAVQICDQSRTNQIEGMGPIEASVSGARMLAAPMLNGTLTTIASFVPMVIFFEGGNREFIYSLPVTLSVMLAVSWVLAMTFCVILAAMFIRPPKSKDQPSAPLVRCFYWFKGLFRRKRPADEFTWKSENQHYISRIYGVLVSQAIKHKFLTLGVSIGLFFLALKLPVSTEFFPQGERDQFVVGVWLPENVSIEQTNQAARQVEELLRKLSPTTDEAGNQIERLRAMRTLVGGGGSRWYLSWNPESRKANYAEILIRTSDPKLTHDFAQQVRQVALTGDANLGIEPLPGIRVVPMEMMLGPPAAPVALRITGNGFADLHKLREVAGQVEKLIRDQPETWNTHDSWGADGYQLQVNVDADRASLAGVSNAQIASTLNTYYSGKQLTMFREGDYSVPVYFRLIPEGRKSVSTIESAYIEGRNGKVPIKSVAAFEYGWEPAVIERRDMNRTIEVSARVEPGASGNDIVSRIMSSDEFRQIEANLPNGFRIEIGGALEESMQASGMMLKAFGMSFVTILLLLVIQFNSISKSIMIIFTLPLALIGALLGLYLTSNPLGFMPQLGILSLFGIVLNTAIIFMEFADYQIASRSKASNGRGPIVGLTRDEFRDCLAEAGKQRLLPIFLTTATTVGGLLPLALAGGPLWVGMAWLMIVGLLMATLLTLFVIPALYAIIVENFRISPLSVPMEDEPVLKEVPQPLSAV